MPTGLRIVLAATVGLSPMIERSFAHAQPASRLLAYEGTVHPLYGVPPPPEPPHPNQLQADLGLGVIGLAYERTVTSRVAVQIEAHVFGTWWGPFFDLPRFGGVGGQIRPTFFVSDPVPHGVYIAPFFRAESVTTSVGSDTGRGSGWSAGVFGGYSLVLGAFDLRLGAGAQYMSYGADVGATHVAWKRFHPALDLLVGYMF